MKMPVAWVEAKLRRAFAFSVLTGKYRVSVLLPSLSPSPFIWTVIFVVTFRRGLPGVSLGAETKQITVNGYRKLITGIASDVALSFLLVFFATKRILSGIEGGIPIAVREKGLSPGYRATVKG